MSVRATNIDNAAAVIHLIDLDKPWTETHFCMRTKCPTKSKEDVFEER